MISNKALYLHNEAHDRPKTWLYGSMVELINHASNSIFRKKSHTEGFPNPVTNVLIEIRILVWEIHK